MCSNPTSSKRSSNEWDTESHRIITSPPSLNLHRNFKWNDFKSFQMEAQTHCTLSNSSVQVSPQSVRKVSFNSTVLVREYGITVGSLTASSNSCPVQLSWEYNQIEKMIKIQDFEETYENFVSSILVKTLNLSSQMSNATKPNRNKLTTEICKQTISYEKIFFSKKSNLIGKMKSSLSVEEKLPNNKMTL